MRTILLALFVLSISLGIFANRVSKDDLRNVLKKVQNRKSLPGFKKQNPDVIKYRNTVVACNKFSNAYGINNVNEVEVEEATKLTVIKYTRGKCVGRLRGPYCPTWGKYEKRIHVSAGGPACLDEEDKS